MRERFRPDPVIVFTRLHTQWRIKMNFPVGIAVGLAMGVAIGIASGRQRLLEAIVAYAQTQGIVLHDASGAHMSWEAFLGDAVQVSDGQKRPVLIALLLLGLGLLVGLLAYLWLRGG